jgi:hypothetical protein
MSIIHFIKLCRRPRHAVEIWITCIGFFRWYQIWVWRVPIYCTWCQTNSREIKFKKKKRDQKKDNALSLRKRIRVLFSHDSSELFLAILAVASNSTVLCIYGERGRPTQKGPKNLAWTVPVIGPSSWPTPVLRSQSAAFLLQSRVNSCISQ